MAALPAPLPDERFEVYLQRLALQHGTDDPSLVVRAAERFLDHAETERAAQVKPTKADQAFARREAKRLLARLMRR